MTYMEIGQRMTTRCLQRAQAIFTELGATHRPGGSTAASRRTSPVEVSELRAGESEALGNFSARRLQCKPDELTSVKFLGRFVVLFQKGVGVDVGEFKRTHVRERPSNPSTPKANVLYSWHDPAEQALAEHPHGHRCHCRLDALVDW